MANMSYCRFENTFHDLQDCQENMADELDRTEKRFRDKLIALCKEIVEDFGNEEDEN